MHAWPVCCKIFPLGSSSLGLGKGSMATKYDDVAALLKKGAKKRELLNNLPPGP